MEQIRIYRIKDRMDRPAFMGRQPGIVFLVLLTCLLALWVPGRPAEAAVTNYHWDLPNAAGDGTNWTTACGSNPTSSRISHLVAGTTFTCSTSTYVSIARAVDATVWIGIAPTVVTYPNGVIVNGQAGSTWRASNRTANTSVTMKVELGYWNGTTFTSFGNGATYDFVNAGTVLITPVTLDLSGITGIAPVGTRIAVRASTASYTGTGNFRLYFGPANNNGGRFGVDVRDNCTPTGTISVTPSPRTNSPINLTPMVTSSGATPATYSVTETASCFGDRTLFTGNPTQATSVSTVGWRDCDYTLLIEGTDNACGTPVSASGQFHFTPCPETATVTLDTLPNPMTTGTPITATVGGVGGSNAQVSIDNVNWYPSGWVFNPPENTTGTQDFRARAMGSCGGYVYDQRGWIVGNYNTTVPYCDITTCGGCHAMPPRDSVSGQRGNPDGSVAGSHQAHKDRACSVCHVDNGTNYGHANTFVGMAASINGGTYGSKGTSFPVVSNPTLQTCSNTSCHYTTSPVWGSNQVMPCNGCHGYPPIGAGVVSHAGSDGTGTELMQQHFDCYICHLTKDDGTGQHKTHPNYSKSANHVNGYIAMNSTSGYTRTNGGCDTACHPNDPSHRMSISSLPLESLVGPAGCNGCHGYPPITLHAEGAQAVDHEFSGGGLTMMASHDECGLCHGNKDDGTGKHSPTAADYTVAANHNNGKIMMNGPTVGHASLQPAGAQYNESNYGCDNACHSNAPAYQFTNSGMEVEYGNFGPRCDSCHGYPPVPGDGKPYLDAPPYAESGFSEGKGAHAIHVAKLLVYREVAALDPVNDRFGTGTAALICGSCHTNDKAQHSQSASNPDPKQMTVAAEFQFESPATPNYSGVSNTSSNTNYKVCTNVNCHFGGTSPGWQDPATSGQ